MLLSSAFDAKRFVIIAPDKGKALAAIVIIVARTKSVASAVQADRSIIILLPI
jgi:hypothetical protein